jgi:hypothetical protein
MLSAKASAVFTTKAAQSEERNLAFIGNYLLIHEEGLNTKGAKRHYTFGRK